MSDGQRTFIAALQVSLDGYVQGPDGEADWVDSWADALGLLGPSASAQESTQSASPSGPCT